MGLFGRVFYSTEYGKLLDYAREEKEETLTKGQKRKVSGESSNEKVSPDAETRARYERNRRERKLTLLLKNLGGSRERSWKLTMF
jgi:hypothetical protein